MKPHYSFDFAAISLSISSDSGEATSIPLASISRFQDSINFEIAIRSSVDLDAIQSAEDITLGLRSANGVTSNMVGSPVALYT